MPFGTSFADAEAEYEDADFCIYGIPYDHTACFRAGAREAPNTIRRCSYNFERTHFEHGRHQPEYSIYDYGDCDDSVLPEDMMEEVRFAMTPAINDGKFTIAMGGDHSVNIPIVRLFEKKDISLISVDAHLDYRDEYMGVKNSHACITRRASEHLGVDNVFVLGIRSVSDDELDEEVVVPHIDAYQIADKGMPWAIKKALDSVKNERVYITIDIDGIDPAYAPGTGTPEPFGLMPIDVKKLIDATGDRLIGMDVVEVCPPADPSGITSILAARLMKEAIAVHGKCLKQ
jgi:agmatinase